MARKSFNEINITPLTDIFLVLLIIMMVIAPMLDQQGLSLAVPEYVEQNTIKNEPKILTVEVTQDNKYVIEGKTIALNDLASYLKNNQEAFSDGVLIEAQSNSSHGSVVKLMDTVRNIGVTSISITEI